MAPSGCAVRGTVVALRVRATVGRALGAAVRTAVVALRVRATVGDTLAAGTAVRAAVVAGRVRAVVRRALRWARPGSSMMPSSWISRCSQSLTSDWKRSISACFSLM